MAQQFTAGRYKSWLDSGQPNAGGRLYTYASGTTTFKAAYTDATLATPCTYTSDGVGGQYIALDARGEAAIWLGAGAYSFAPKTAAAVGMTGTDGVEDAESTAFASMLAILSNTTDPTKGAGAPTFVSTLNYAAGTIGWADKLHGLQLEWFYQTADAGDYSGAFTRACAALLLLTGAPYGDSMGQGSFGYGVSRRLNLAGKKYMTNSALVIPSGDISIYGFGGGFYPGPSFPAGSYVLDTGADPYGGTGFSVTIDGQDKNVKGILFRNINGALWDKLKVVSCRNDGIVYAAGSELSLTNFEVSGSATPNALTVAGLRTQSSDGHFINGTIKFTPIGRKGEGGGNNQFVNVHCWGTYTGFRMYLPFYSVNTVRDTFVGCYADSPAKQDYTQDNLVVLNGIPNGGIGFYFDTTSTQNSMVSCLGLINTTLWAAYASANSITGNHFYDVYSAGSFTNIKDLVHNYAGNWAGDIRWASNAVRDSSLVVGSPNTANGIRAAIIASISDAGGGVQNMSVENTNAGFATSESRFTWRLGGGDTTYAGAVFGPGGSPYWYINHVGLERFRIIANGSIQPGSDNSQNFGSGSLRWAQFFAGTATIGTSDQREKQDIASLTAAEKAVGTALKGLVKSYRWKASVAEKGTDARTHVGWIAQDVMAAFTAQGLDSMAYGVCCYDKWDAEPETVDEDGKVTRAALAAGDRYGIRHDELVAFILGAI